MRENRGKVLVSTGSSDVAAIRRLVDLIQRDSTSTSSTYQVNSSTLEDVFLDLNTDIPVSEEQDPDSVATALAPTVEITPAESKADSANDIRDEKDLYGEKDMEAVPAAGSTAYLDLTPGRKGNYFAAIPGDAWTITRKRMLVFRRSWILPVLGILMVICATCIPLFYLGSRGQTCDLITRERFIQPLTYPRSFYPLRFPPLLVAPASALGVDASAFGNIVETVSDNATFVETLENNRKGYPFGGISLNPDANGQSLFAWEGSAVLNKGLSALNLLSNQLLNRLSPPTGTALTDGFRINLDFQFLPTPSFRSTAEAMRWIAFLWVQLGVPFDHR